MTDQTLSDLRERKAQAIERRKEHFERLANSGTEVAPRAQSLLDWLEVYREEHPKAETEGVPAHV